MRPFIIGATALLTFANTAGCSSYLPVAQSQALTTITVGMTREEVIKQLGEPHRQEVFGKTELLSYRSDWRVPTANSYSPVGIVDGKVAGAGPSYEFKVKLDYKSEMAALKK